MSDYVKEVLIPSIIIVILTIASGKLIFNNKPNIPVKLSHDSPKYIKQCEILCKEKLNAEYDNVNWISGICYCK